MTPSSVEPTLEAGDPRPSSSLPPSAAAAPPPSSGRGRRLAALWLFVLLALGAAGWFGWQWWQQRTLLAGRAAEQVLRVQALDSRLAALETLSAEQGSRLADQSRQADRNGTDIAALQSRIDDTLTLMSRVSEDLAGGRTRFQLAAVEHLMVLANDRLLLERDVRSALVALDAADASLARISNPQLFPVREALARERTELRAVPVADLASAALTLASLIGRVPDLPLASHAPAQFESPDAREAPAQRVTSGWQRVLSAVRTAASSLFTVRREENARALRLLPPEAEAVIYHVLTLRLEAARVALLTGNSVVLREECRSAGQWLDTQFKRDDPGVMAMGAELERLEALELAPPLPDISRSLAALRARLDTAPSAALP